ncbi:MAG: transposase [Candidatus Azotimanducaceae bacterium]|jgi:transposase
MTQSNILFVGMDVHKESIEIALAEDGIGGEVRRIGCIGGAKDAFKKALRKLVSKGHTLHFCYEAGPTGYELYRFIVSEGHICSVVAPLLIPKKPGGKVKTDKRDASELARLYRGGELTPVYVPKPEDEAIRDLSRAREDIVTTKKKAKQRLKSFLLRHEFRCPHSENWNEAHLRWLAVVKLPHPVLQIVYQEYLNSVTETVHREERILRDIEEHVSQWRLFPAVQALMALRGRVVVATTIIAELGDVARFDNPKS